MTAPSLLTALAVGLLVGIVGLCVGHTTHLMSVWLPPSVGIGAALLGTIAARLAGVDSPRVTPVEIGLQIALATITVAAVITTTDRRPTSDRPDHAAGTR